MRTRRLPGLMHVDHAAYTVPNLDEAVDFFVDVMGAEELYRSQRGPDPSAMPVNFEVPADAALELCMLRLPPNLNGGPQTRGRTTLATATEVGTICASRSKTWTKPSNTCVAFQASGFWGPARRSAATAPLSQAIAGPTS